MFPDYFKFIFYLGQEGINFFFWSKKNAVMTNIKQVLYLYVIDCEAGSSYPLLENLI